MSPTGKQFVIEYLNKLHLKPSKNFRQFWNDLEYKHGRSQTDTLRRAMDQRVPGSTTNEIYNLKNQSLKLSLDFSAYSADLYRKFFEWLADRPQKRTHYRWLDVGCDNGIVTCFIASLFPEAEVVGVDVLGSAITCAEELASRLELTNVRFVQADVRQLDGEFVTNSFDRIVSVRSFHEILGDVGEPPHHWSTEALLQETQDMKSLRFLRSIHELLRDESSELITFERLSWMGSTGMWVHELEGAGLYVKWDDAEIISFHEVGENQKLPVLVCGTKPRQMDTLEGLYELYTGRQETRVLAAGTEYEDASAEVLFQRLEGKQFLCGLQISFPEDAKMRYEVWQTSEFVLLYQATNIGYRKLNILSPELLASVVNDVQTVLPSQYRNQGREVHAYEVVGI